MPSTPRPSVRLDALTFEFYTDNTILTKDKKFTYLTADVSSGTALTVQSIVGFNSLTTSSGQIVCIGEIGQENTEILRTDQNNAASGSTVSLRDAVSFTHPQDTKVYILNWNQFAISRSTGISSQKSTLTSGTGIPIQADQLESVFRDTTNTTGYGFVEFRDSINAAYSPVSDPVPYTGYDDNTVYMIKKRALDSINETVDGNLITHDFLNNALWEGRREYHNSAGKRPFRKIFNFSAGTVSTGMYRFVVPTNLERPYTAENVYGVRIGVQPNMTYYDKKQWDQDYQGVAHTTLPTADASGNGYTIGNKDLYVADAREFTFSGGSVTVEDDTIAYSAVGISGGTLRISTAGKQNHPVGADVWQGVTSGLPGNFTVFSDVAPPEFSFTGSVYVYFSTPVSTVYVNQDIFMDYYSKVLGMDSDADTLDEPDFDMFVPYLAWRVKQRKNKGLNPLTDSDYITWQQKKTAALAKEYLGTDIRLNPDVGHLNIPHDDTQ